MLRGLELCHTRREPQYGGRVTQISMIFEIRIALKKVLFSERPTIPGKCLVFMRNFATA